MNVKDLLSDALADLDTLRAAGLAAFERAATPDQVEAVRVEYLGQKHGRVKAAQERLKNLEPSARKSYGQRFNAVKGELESAFEAARARVEKKDEDRGRIDVTLPGLRPRLGHRHPLTQTAEEVIDLFGRLVFAGARGREVEDVRHNFDALNIPPSHPARDPLDNFYLAVGEKAVGAGLPGSGVPMLRSQTSTVQIRVMEAQQ